jgi:AcrR family transcriptional regulator
MVRAAHELFVERGYGGTRIVDVAERAGVAVQTVYFRFHTKRELLQACYDAAVMGEQDPAVPMAQPEIAAMFSAAPGPQALTHFADGNSAICARVGLLDDVIRSAAHEPEAVEVRLHSERLRRDGYRMMVESLAQRFGLREGLSLDDATDLMLAFGGTGMYRALVIEYGWSDDAYIDWLAQTLTEQLLAQSTNQTPGRRVPRRP